MSDLYRSLSHSKWDCKYHVVFVPKRRRRVLFVRLRRQLGPIFHALAQQKIDHVDYAAESHIVTAWVTVINKGEGSLHGRPRPL